MNVVANALATRSFSELALSGLVIVIGMAAALLIALRRAARPKIERKPFLT